MRWLVALLVLSPPGIALGCSCERSDDVQDDIDGADVIFAGEVVDVDAPGGCGGGSSADPVYVTFDVARVYKGSASADQVVVTAASGASCGVAFEQGADYLVHASRRDGELHSSLCQFNKRLYEPRADEELSLLGEGEPPSAAGACATGRVPDLGWWVLALLLLTPRRVGTGRGGRRRRRPLRSR